MIKLKDIVPGKVYTFKDNPPFQVNEGLKRFKVYVSGEKEPLILLGKNEKDVKQTAHSMIQNSSVKIRKVVKEGLNEYGAKTSELEGTSKGPFGRIYQMKDEMAKGEFDPKNPQINVHGLGVYNLKLLEKVIKRDLTKAANDLGYESGINNLMYHLYRKHSPLGSKIKGLWEVYQQMNSPQYKRAVTMYKRKR